MATPELQEALAGLDFEGMDYETAVREIRALADPVYLTAREFYEGDHWQGGDAWVGPHPAPDEDGDVAWKEIEEGLVAHPALEEIVNRHRDAVVGQEPFWSFVPRRPMEPKEQPTAEEQTLIDELEAMLTEWWDDHDALDVFQLATEDLCLGGRGIGRLFVPEGQLAVTQAGDSVVPEGPIDEQMERIWPTFIPADEGAVPRDPLTMQRFGIFLYEVENVLSGGVTKYAELTYLDADKQTRIRTTSQFGGTTEEVTPMEMTWDLGGRLTMFEMQSKALITEPILANQKLLNKTGTMLSRNVDLGGFLERVILNGQLPGKWVEDDDGNKTFVADKFELGAGTTNQVIGIQTGVKDDGTAVISDARIQYRDPVDVTCFKETMGIAYRTVLTAARQLHVLIAADANASGESRKQARDDFSKSLKRTKTRLDRFGRWMLETTAQMAATLAGDPRRFDKLRCVFNTQLDPGPISADDRAATLNEYEAKVRSQEGTMAILGIDDTGAEQATIAAEEAAAAKAAASAPMNDLQKTALERAKLGLAADKAALGTTLPPAGGGA